jgi:hypothetical protein
VSKYLVVDRRPSKRRPKLPAIDEVAQNVDLLRVEATEKAQQMMGLRVSAAQVNVAYEERTHFAFHHDISILMGLTVAS